MARRAFQLVVLFFAIYAFAFVPLGKRTALEHVRAIIGTPAAQQAASEVKGGVERLAQRLRSEAQRATESTELEREEEPEPAPPASTKPPARTTPASSKRIPELP